jgi:hypothetical protein
MGDTASPAKGEENTLDESPPTIKVYWGRGADKIKTVVPDHNDSADPDPTTGDKHGRLFWIRKAEGDEKKAPDIIKGMKVPTESRAQAIVELTNVADDVKAEIEVRHCRTNKVVKFGTLKNLKVKDGKVVDPRTDEPPVISFESRQKPWEEKNKDWKSPFYYFKAHVKQGNLKGETPKDYEKKEDECLRVEYWCVAVPASSLPGVLGECNTAKGLIEGVKNAKAHVQHYPDDSGTSLDTYIPWIRNTYAFLQASHGTVCSRKTNSSGKYYLPTFVTAPGGGDWPADGTKTSEFRSVVCMSTRPYYGDTEISDKTRTLSVPRYLYYADCCNTGWEPSFAKAMMARGCKHVLAFKVTIPDGMAVNMSRDFWTEWATNQKLDPEKIADSYNKIISPYEARMKPVLYGAESGGLSAGQIALIAVAVVAAGALIGVAVWSLMK